MDKMKLTAEELGSLIQGASDRAWGIPPDIFDNIRPYLAKAETYPQLARIMEIIDRIYWDTLEDYIGPFREKEHKEKSDV